MSRLEQVAALLDQEIIRSRLPAFRAPQCDPQPRQRGQALPDRVAQVLPVVVRSVQAEFVPALPPVRNVPVVRSVQAVPLLVQPSPLLAPALALAVHLVRLVPQAVVLRVLRQSVAVVPVALGVEVVLGVEVAPQEPSANKAENRIRRGKVRSYVAKSSTICRRHN